jgi:magnesium/cobalt transport protein CorA
VGEAAFVDLLDPDEEALTRAAAGELVPADVWQALRPPGDGRPRIVARTGYVSAVLLVAVAVPEEDRIYYQELDLIAFHDRLVLVRKSPPDGEPFDTQPVHESCRPGDPPGQVVGVLLDTVAERYLELVDDLDGEIGELEDEIEHASAREVGRRIADLRHDILRIRKTLTPTRDAVRRLVDGRINEEAGRDVITHDGEMKLADVYDKLLRATESLDFARDSVASARDYHQSLVANQQNEVMKRLAVVASLLLLPTFIVGVYGQNFAHMPELHWRLGYLFSWLVIVATTIGQLAFFRWKRWL